MIDHIGLRTTRFEDMTAFYDAVLKPLGYRKLAEFPGAAGFGRNDEPTLWLGEVNEEPTGIHLAITAPTPMTTPRMVRIERMVLRRMARTARMSVSQNIRPPRGWGRRPRSCRP